MCLVVELRSWQSFVYPEYLAVGSVWRESLLCIVFPFFQLVLRQLRMPLWWLRRMCVYVCCTCLDYIATGIALGMCLRFPLRAAGVSLHTPQGFREHTEASTSTHINWVYFSQFKYNSCGGWCKHRYPPLFVWSLVIILDTFLFCVSTTV